MTHRPFSTRHLLCLMLAAGASLPALAAQTTVPGVMCQSDSGNVDRPVNGALINTAPSSGTTKFYCPIVRTNSIRTIPTLLTVYIFAQTNYSPERFNCVLRTINSDGSTYMSTEVLLPSDNSVRWVGSQTIAFPPNQSASAHLRCNVPNTYANTQAGILFLRIDD